MEEERYPSLTWQGWKIVKKLGRGGYGSVYQAQRNSAGVMEDAAIKVISFPSVSMQTQNINIEIEHLVNLGSDPQAYMLYGSYRNEEEYKDEDGSYAEKHADDYDYMILQLADSEEYEVQILPVELQADTDFLNSDLAGKTDEELKDEVGLTDQQISALHEYWQYNHMRANFVERKKWVPYISEKNQMDILKNGERYYFPVFTSAAEMKEYGKKFYQREVYISDAINMAKESRYVLTGLVINAFTDSVILNWDQLGTGIPNADEEEKTTYKR